jgi:S-formylglutathione hydrolase FrmB
MQLRYLMIAALLVAAGTTFAAGESRVECNAISSAILQRPVRYCVMLPPSYDAQKTQTFPVLYFLHGLGDNEQALFNSGGWEIAEGLRKSSGLGEFLIVTPDGGHSFYINSRDGKVRYEDFFFREFLPAIERKYRAATTPNRRALAGVSMGGYGALRYAFQYPSRFAAVAVQMPALLDRLPPALTSGTAHGQGDLLSAFGNVPSEAFWEQNSPLTLARADAAQLKHLKIYFDCGDQDDFGFTAGARSLDRILNERGVPHEFHIYPGHHDWQYVAAHFPAVLQFVWRVIKP